jgi:cob(II)yrinic acid a,c-diamide reductase
MTNHTPPVFDDQFRKQLTDLFSWRRDVRRFKETPVPEALITEILDYAQSAPSVGNSQPWRWVRIVRPDLRKKLAENYERHRQKGGEIYENEQADLYNKLKLSGFDKAPLQFAVFCDKSTGQGLGLGRQTMPETLEYSVVAMITTFWMHAHSYGLGVGWVSVIDPKEVTQMLDVPDTWRLVACLCVGWPEEQLVIPELETAGWQARTPISRTVLVR